MLKEISALREDNVIAFEVSGKLSKEDYLNIFHPLIDAAAKDGKKIRALIHFSPHFEGFSLGAAWEDFKLGVHHWHSFEKLCVVTDKAYITNSVKFFSALMPGEIRVYPENERDEACDWFRN